MANEPERIDSIATEAAHELKERSKARGATLSDEDVIKGREHAEMMRRPYLWPGGHHALPLRRKRRKGGSEFLQVAILVPREDGYEVHQNMTILGTSLGEEVIVRHFVDAEDVLMAGWEVD